MADKEVKVTKEVKQPITDKIDAKNAEAKPQATAPAAVVAHQPLKSPYFWLIIASAVLLALIVAGIIFAVVRHQQYEQQASQQQGNGSSYGYGGGFGGRGRGSYWSETSSQDGPTTTTTVTNYTYTSGVVTKVSSGSLTVAGNGKAQTIKTNSSTQYVGDTKPAVNDSVTIVGTADSKGTVTATQIRVDNQ